MLHLSILCFFQVLFLPSSLAFLPSKLPHLSTDLPFCPPSFPPSELLFCCLRFLLSILHFELPPKLPCLPFFKASLPSYWASFLFSASWVSFRTSFLTVPSLPFQTLFLPSKLPSFFCLLSFLHSFQASFWNFLPFYLLSWSPFLPMNFPSLCLLSFLPSILLFELSSKHYYFPITS